MVPGAGGTRHWPRARSPLVARFSIREESIPEISPGDSLRRRYREYGSRPGYSGGAETSWAVIRTALFEKSSSVEIPSISIVLIDIIENSTLTTKAKNRRREGGYVISAGYERKKGWERRVAQGFALKGARFGRLYNRCCDNRPALLIPNYALSSRATAKPSS